MSKSIIAILALLLTATLGAAETTVTISGAHLCCGKCNQSIQGALGAVEGAEATIEKTKAGKVIRVQAGDVATAQAAIDAIQTAGFYGTTDHEEVTFDDELLEVEGEGPITVGGLHVCCGACKKTIEGALAERGTVAIEGGTVTVDGEASASEVTTDLREAGLNGTASR